MKRLLALAAPLTSASARHAAHDDLPHAGTERCAAALVVTVLLLALFA